jgi:hypothetical protein
MAYDLPITISEGDFSDPASGLGTTPLAKIAVRFSEAVINSAWTIANTKTTAFDAKMAAARAELPDISTEITTLDVTADTATSATIVEPTVTISDVPASTAYADFEAQYTELVTVQGTKLASFLTAYFPDDTALYGAAEDWIQAAIANGGIPTTIQSQMLADDKDRITADASRASDAALATFAARRFPLPPGQAASAVMQIQQKAQEEIAASSRKISLVSIEQMRFNIEKAINCRQMAMSSVLDYVKTIMQAPEVSSRLVGVGYDAQSKMIGAAASFLNARADVAKVANQVSQFNASSKLEADTKNQAASLGLIIENLKTYIVEAQQAGQQATAMYNNLHASAGTTLSI